MDELSELIKYAEDAQADSYPFEVTGDDIAIVLEALRLLKATREQSDRY